MMRAKWLAVVAFVALSACGTIGGKPFVRAFAAGDRAYTAGRFAEAAVAYEEAAAIAERDRDRDEALYAAADARVRANDDAGALVLFDKLAAAKPPGERAIRAAFRAARIRIAKGDTKKGYADLAAILKLAPEHGIAKRALRAVVLHVEETEGKAAAIQWEESLMPAVEGTRLGEEICYDIALRKEQMGNAKEAAVGFLTCADRYPYPLGALWDDSLWRASLVHEGLGDHKAAIADLEKMLAAREKSYMSGSYNRPRMAPAQFRIAELQRDRLNDKAAARASFHKVYSEHPTSILRARALFEEAKLAAEASDASNACSLAGRIIDEFAHTRWARKADEPCPSLGPKAEALRKARAERRKKAAKTDDDD